MSQRSRERQRRIRLETIERRRIAYIETFAKDDPELFERLSAMPYSELVAWRNSSEGTQPTLPTEGGSDA